MVTMLLWRSHHRCLFYPKKVFLPSGAQLRELLTYPNPGSEISDNKALEILKVVGLEVVNERYSLDGTADWSACLSGGQKQRLGWARLFFHCPKFALCDEATAAISKDGIDVLFDYAQNTLGITLLTISHSPQVDAHHTHALDLLGGGTYKITNLVDNSA
mmetsp:Transcript_17043/g.27551  ORF Transcript_17043/g.27551 Transcript_17043/m.27551 type:complete len:160 (-) Transcript_17043:29-508(-)